jgi:hypothetical protein
VLALVPSASRRQHRGVDVRGQLVVVDEQLEVQIVEAA